LCPIKGTLRLAVHVCPPSVEVNADISADAAETALDNVVSSGMDRNSSSWQAERLRRRVKVRSV
jgi:hypothetical protein